MTTALVVGMAILLVVIGIMAFVIYKAASFLVDLIQGQNR